MLDQATSCKACRAGDWWSIYGIWFNMRFMWVFSWFIKPCFKWIIGV